MISRKRLLEAAAKHDGLGRSLDAWYRIAKSVTWRSLAEVRRLLPSADSVGKYTVFNIKGNAFRLISEINYGGQRVYVRHVLTHREYDKGAWKK